MKQACSQVWKAVVQNTPRTLRELLPTLMERLIVLWPHRHGAIMNPLGHFETADDHQTLLRIIWPQLIGKSSG